MTLISTFHVLATYTTESEILESVKHLKAANVTRCNSQLTMIRSIPSVSIEKLDSLMTHHLTTYDLEELVEILTPLTRLSLAV